MCPISLPMDFSCPIQCIYWFKKPKVGPENSHRPKNTGILPQSPANFRLKPQNQTVEPFHEVNAETTIRRKLSVFKSLQTNVFAFLLRTSLRSDTVIPVVYSPRVSTATGRFSNVNMEGFETAATAIGS